MSLWDADHPGTTVAWWTQRRECFPASLYKEFEDFLEALTLHNVYSNPTSLRQLQSVTSRLMDKVRSASPSPTLSPGQRLGNLLNNNFPSLNINTSRSTANNNNSKNVGAAPQDTNLVTVLNNLLKQLGTRHLPEMYDF